MNFNLKLEKLNKKNYQRNHYGKILTVRLPCNPIFPIGPIYLADHIHKCFPGLDQQFIDLAIIPSNKVSKYLARKIDQFRPHLIIFSWRDIQIYAPVDGRSGNPLQNSFEVFYSKNIFKIITSSKLGNIPDNLKERIKANLRINYSLRRNKNVVLYRFNKFEWISG